MEHPRMATPDITDGNIDKIGVLFPNCITETKGEKGTLRRTIDFDLLRQELSKDIVEGPQERYQFTWPDKRKAIRTANTPIDKTLRPCREESVNFDTTKNLYIEGDNLEALKLLRENYLGRVKMIYIDPPYNTGNDFVYKDDMSMSKDDYDGISGQKDEDGNRLVANHETNGRFHTDWLNMIYPRLKVARDLLTEDGVIFISIDENEIANLQKVADDIFGEQNFISQLIWAAGRKNDSKYISVSHEYILCYVKSIQYLKENKIVWREKKQGLDDIYSEYNSLLKKYQDKCDDIERELKKWYKNLPDGHPAKDHAHYNRVDKKGIYFASDISWPGGGGPKYEVIHPITGLSVRIPSRGWITNQKTLSEWIKQDLVDFGPDESFVPTLKAYLRDMEYSVPYSVFYKDGRAASKRLAVLMEDKVFENPKDEEIISRLVDFTTGDGDIILDFFSGSATTAHGVFLRTKLDEKNRHFILVQIPDIINPEKEPAGKARKVAENAVKLLDSIGVPHTICEIGKERIRRAGRKIREEKQGEIDKLRREVEALDRQIKAAGEGSLFGTEDVVKARDEKRAEVEQMEKRLASLDTGFRVLKVDESNMLDVYYTPEKFDGGLFEDNIKPGRSDEDLLFQVMLESNMELSCSIEKKSIQGKTVWFADGNYLIACFEKNLDENVITAIARMKPYYFYMRDWSLGKDSLADNFDQLFEYYSPDTVRKIL